MEIARVDRLPAPRSLLIVATASAAITLLCILVLDQPVARWLAGYEPLGFWDRGIEALEWAIGLPVFKWLAGIVLVGGMIITVVVPRWRGQAPAWMLIAATHVLSRIATLEVKLATARLRPGEWLAQGGDTFLREGGVSFPSGHVALFASLVIPLAVVAPRTRPLLAIAAYAMLARLAVNAHFVSDVIGAIALVCVVTWVCGWVIRPLRRA